MLIKKYFAYGPNLTWFERVWAEPINTPKKWQARTDCRSKNETSHTQRGFREQQSEKEKKMPEEAWAEKDLCFCYIGGDVNWTQISYL